MEYEKKQRIYKTIMLVVLTITISVIGTTIALYKYWGQHQGIRYIMAPMQGDELTSEITRLKSFIDKYYLGEVDEQELADCTLQGYIQGLNDEYSEYIPKKDMESFSANTMGNYTGIGIYYGRLVETKEVVIISSIKGTPAYNVRIITRRYYIKNR